MEYYVYSKIATKQNEIPLNKIDVKFYEKDENIMFDGKVYFGAIYVKKIFMGGANINENFFPRIFLENQQLLNDYLNKNSNKLNRHELLEYEYLKKKYKNN
jgi:hypothetical protein